MTQLELQHTNSVKCFDVKFRTSCFLQVYIHFSALMETAARI